MQLLKGKNILSAILFLVVAILVILMVSNTSYVPYSRNEQFPKYATYEGLTMNNEFVSEEPTLEGNVAVKGNTYGSPSSILSSLFQSNPEGFSGNVNTVMSPVNESEIIDKFSQVSDGSSNNDSKCPSGGLSNSKGALCLTPELVQLLKTRGGNM
jgi:hypothetical protein